MKPFTVDGILINKAELTKQREAMIVLRDASITAGMLDWSFSISITIAILWHVLQELES